jgi:hypothetical protein
MQCGRLDWGQRTSPQRADGANAARQKTMAMGRFLVELDQSILEVAKGFRNFNRSKDVGGCVQAIRKEKFMSWQIVWT